MRFLEKMVQEDYIDESPFGLITPESGKIYVKGQEIRFKDPLDAIKHGVGMVHQHFMLVDELTVAENVVLGAEPIKNGFLIRNQR